MNQVAWKPPTVQNRWRWWLTCRAVPFVTLVTAIGLLGYLLFQPFFHPHVYLLFAATEYPASLLLPHSSPAEDLAAIRSQQDRLIVASGAKDQDASSGLASPGALDAVLDQLERRDIQDRDVLVAWFGAQVVANGGEVDLLCGNFDPMDVHAGRYPLTKLFSRIRECPAHTKLVLLDSGWTTHAPRLGLLADCSAAQLRAIVEETKDPSLWVLLSHADFESSLTIAEPHRSAFAHFLGEALQGAADRDGDRFVDVGEVFHYARNRVADWVRGETGGHSSQTVTLLWGGGQLLSGMSYPLIQPALLKTPVAEAQPGAEGGDAKPPQLSLSKPVSRILPGASVSAKSPAKPEEKSDKGDKSASPGDSAAKAGSDPVLTANAAELQSMAWSLHDRLAESPDFHAINEAPQFWRALQDRLLALQVQAKSADAAQNSAATGDLRRLVRQLSDLCDGRLPQRFQEHDLVPTLAEWTEATEVHATLPCMAAVERFARPLPADLRTTAEHLDAALEKPDSADFRKWVAELPPKFNEIVEFRFATRLANQPNLDWPSVRLLMKVRRLAERVAIATLDVGPWTREQIEHADQLRLAGERSLLAAVRPGDVPEAMELLERAMLEYEQAANWNRDVVALKRLTSEALFCLLDYLQWSIKSIPDAEAVSPDTGTLEHLIAAVRHSLNLLDRPAAATLPDVRRLRHELEILLGTLQKRVMVAARVLPTGPQANGAAPMPQTEGLVAADLRLRLHGLPDWSSPAGVAAGVTAARREAEDPTSRFRSAAKTYAAATLLLLGDLPQIDKKAGALAAAAEFDADKADAVELRKACVRFGNALGDLLQSLPETIQELSSQNQDMTDPAKRARQIRNLAAARRLLYLVHPWDTYHMDFTGPSQLLRRAELYDLLVWQRQRFAAAGIDAESSEMPYLVDAANAFGRVAAAIPRQPPIADVRQPGIEIELPGQLDLANESQREFAVSVTNKRDREIDIWLTADYNAEALTLQARDGETLYDESSVHGLPGTNESSNWRSDGECSSLLALDKLSPTFRLQPGETKALWLQLHRKSVSGGDARIAFRAISQSDCSRRDLTAILPHRLTVDLVAEGIADSWRSQDAALTLYPFPNRATPYTLSLVNAGDAERLVDFEILRIDNLVDTPPLGDVSSDLAEKFLAHLGSVNHVLKVEKIPVAGGGRRVPIPFVPPVAPPKPPAPAPAAASDAAPAEKLPSLAGSLLAVVTDRASGRRLIKRIEIFTQRPARYVRPSVEYDPERRRADITVKPVKPSDIPPDGVWIEGQPEEGEAADGRHRSGMWLRPPAAEATVHVEVPRDSGPVFTVLVNVDGFDRAFRYEIPTAATTRTPVSESSRVAVRIIEPRPGTCYGPQTSEVSVSLQVDAPHGLLLDGGSFVEVGIDTNRDRELRHKESLRLTSDRQVELLLDKTAPDGTFVIRTRVSDLHVSLPPPKLKAMRANVLGRVSLAARDVWSEPIEVVFDDEPPRLSRLQLAPGATVNQGNELEVSVLASDNELSGVAKVEAAFDLQRKGEFADPPPLPASMQTDGRWSVKIPTKPLRPGLYGLLVRATDRLGNSSEYLKSSVEIVPADAGTGKPSVLGRIEGVVVYGRFEKRPMAGVSVHLADAKGERQLLDAKTNDAGHFNMVDVPPGDYKLSVETLISGNRRTTQKDVKVPAPPAAAEKVELVLSSPR